MQLIFLIPLTTSFISGYLFKRSADEMAYLTGSITIVSLVFTLVLAPWQIQLLILGFVIISTRKLLQRNAYMLQSENQEKVEELGAGSKKSASTIKAPESDVKGKYRGSPWKSSQNQMSAPQQPHFDLKYRGANVKR